MKPRRMCLRVFGHPCSGHSIHRMVEGRSWGTFPPRFVASKIDVGWNVCESCGRWHRVWITDDRIWALLPRRARKLRLCTRCYRARCASGAAQWKRMMVRLRIALAEIKRDRGLQKVREGKP